MCVGFGRLADAVVSCLQFFSFALDLLAVAVVSCIGSFSLALDLLVGAVVSRFCFFVRVRHTVTTLLN